MRGERELGRWVGWALLIALLLAVAAVAGVIAAIWTFLVGWAARIF